MSSGPMHCRKCNLIEGMHAFAHTCTIALHMFSFLKVKKFLNVLFHVLYVSYMNVEVNMQDIFYFQQYVKITM